MNPTPPSLFLGDSLVDYEVARMFSLDFVFVYGASNVSEWKSKIDQKEVVACVQNFED